MGKTSNIQSNQPNTSKKYYSVKEASEITGLPVSWFYWQSHIKKLPGFHKFCKYLRINLDELMTALEKVGDNYEVA